MTCLPTPGIRGRFKGGPFPRDVERVCSACRRVERCFRDPPAHPCELTFPHAGKCSVLLHRKYQKPLLFSSLAPESMQFGNWVGRQLSSQDETFRKELPTYRMGPLLTLSSQFSHPRACSLPGASRPTNGTQISCKVRLKSPAKGAGFQAVIK